MPTETEPADRRVPRSYLFVPGDQPSKFDKAVASGADALILDLEDAVTGSRKDEARAAVRDYLSGTAAGSGSAPSPEMWVRVNSGQLEADLRAVVCGGLRGLLIPKAGPQLLDQADAILTELAADVTIRPGPVGVIPLVESAAGVLSVAELATRPRVVRLGIGEIDLVGELGVQPGPSGAELAPIRSQLVVASAAAGILAPVGPVETNLHDAEHLAETTRALLRQGFRARAAIHPRQVAVINEVFTPSAAELAEAQDVLDRLADAERRGTGVATNSQGRMIDAATMRSAREVLQRGGRSEPA